MSRYILIFCISFIFSSKISANHILGGDVSYTCVSVDSVRAEIIVEFQIFRDGRDLTGQGAAMMFDAEAFFGVYRQVGNGWEYVTQVGPEMYLSDEVVPLNDLECLIFPPSLILRRGDYRFPLTLPLIDQNYMIAFQRCCRGENITNLVNPQNEGSVFSVEITPEGLRSCNDAIQFRQFPPSILCSGFPFRFDHSVVDRERDSVVYSICNPISSGGRNVNSNVDCSSCNTTAPDCGCNFVSPCPALCDPDQFNQVNFTLPFTPEEPVGGDPAITINSSTGLITGTPSYLGELVMAVCASEYRNGQLLTKIRRDMQFVVTECERNLEAIVASDKTAQNGVFELIVCGENVVQFQSLSREERFIDEYVWTFDLGDNNTIVSGARNPVVEYPGFGVYDAQLVLNPDNFICTDSADISIGIFPDINADFDFSFDSCIASPIDFIDESETFGDEIVSWRWDFGEGSRSTEQDPTHFFRDPGLQTTSLLVEDNNECTDTISKSFFYTPIPDELAILPNFYLTCAPGTVTFDNISEPIDSTYMVQWDFGDNTMGPESTELSPTHTYLDPGIYTINLSVTSPTGCTATQSFRDLIEILDGFSMDFSFDPENPDIQRNRVNFTPESIVNGDHYWDFGDGNSSVQVNPINEYADTGVYLVTLIITDEMGCVDRVEKEIYVAPFVDMLFPNAFTPDGDDTNDLFLGVGEISLISSYELQIFDRWGKIVFKTNDPREGWNGKLNNTGQQLPMGVYTYLSKYDVPRSGRQERRGIATLIR